MSDDHGVDLGSGFEFLLFAGRRRQDDQAIRSPKTLQPDKIKFQKSRLVKNFIIQLKFTLVKMKYQLSCYYKKNYSIITTKYSTIKYTFRYILLIEFLPGTDLISCLRNFRQGLAWIPRQDNPLIFGPEKNPIFFFILLGYFGFNSVQSTCIF